jgi:hypothetical protein
MNPVEEKLIIKYLLRHYPIIRIKDNKHFKRGIVLIKNVDGFTERNNYPLRKDENKRFLIKEVSEDLALVFGINPDYVIKLVNDYINRT